MILYIKGDCCFPLNKGPSELSKEISHSKNIFQAKDLKRLNAMSRFLGSYEKEIDLSGQVTGKGILFS